jgi:hypothetical protein
MKRWWNREVLRFVDAWACREGTPEDDEDAERRAAEEMERRDSNGYGPDSAGQGDLWTRGGSGHGGETHGERLHSPRDDDDIRETTDVSDEWIELGVRFPEDEETGNKGKIPYVTGHESD